MSKKAGPLSNESVQGVLRAAEKTRAAMVDSDLAEVMKTPAGRRFVMHLIEERARAFEDLYTTNGSEMNFLLGRRSVGLQVRKDARRVAPELFIQAEAEAESAWLAELRLRDTAIKDGEQSEPE